MPLLHDVKFALRSLLKSPGFTLAAVLTLALGIGANTAVFSLVDRMLLRPLPFPEAGRLVVLKAFNPERPTGGSGFSYPNFLDFQGQSAQLASLAAMCNGAANLSGDGDPERLGTGRVSWRFLEVLGVRPLLGRDFRSEDDRFGSPRVAILGHALWQRRFGADPGILGRIIRLDGESTEVIGVMQPGFECPYGVPNVDLFVPLSVPPGPAQSRGDWFLDCVGRMKADATLPGIQQDMSAIAARLERAHPESNLGYLAKVTPLQEEVVRNARPTLLALLGAVAFVLLIACVNVANLLLARSAGRERELAVRMAIGADRRRLMVQLLAESLLLSLLGAAAGLLLARLSSDALRYVIPFRTPPGGSLDLRMLGFTLGCSLVTALVFGGLPALQASRMAPLQGLREGAKGSAGPMHRRLRRLLVGAEVALATALLAGAGLMVKSLWRLQHVDPGFHAKGLLMASLSLPRAKYPDAAAEQVFEARLLARLSQIPGVKAAALNDTLPLGGSTSSSGYQMEGEPSPRIRPMAIAHRVSLGYFQTLGIPLLKGRDFEPQDSQVAILGERMAKRHWPGGNPIGKRISVGGDVGPWMTILGVAGDVHHMGLAVDPDLEFYMPLLDPSEHGGPRGQAISAILRTEGPPEAWKSAFKAALRDVDPEVPAGRLRSMDELLARDLEPTRAQGLLFSVFGGLALMLASLGIYGVTSFLVAQRRREIGIRMALGARVADVLRMVLGQGLGTVVLGACAGLAGALALGRLLQSQLAGVNPHDPLTFAAVLLLLLGVALLACLIPALRAARVNPAEALRSE